MDTTTVLDKYTQDLSNLPLEVKHLLQELKTKDIQLQETRKKCQTKDSQIHKFIRANGTLTKHPKEQQLYAKIEEDMVAMKKIQKEKILLANTALFLISKHLCNFETDISKLERDGLLPLVENVIDAENGSDSAGGLTGISDGISETATPKPVDFTGGANSANKRPQKRKQLTVRASSSVSGNGNLGGSFANGSIPGSNGNSRPPKRNRSEDLEDDDSLSLELGGGAYGGSTPAGTGMQITATAILSGGAGGSNSEDADNNLYCFCQRVSFGEMIGCDNDDCKYEWFHWACVGITSPPKDDEIWYCPDCSPKMEKRKKKRKS